MSLQFSWRSLRLCWSPPRSRTSIAATRHRTELRPIARSVVSPMSNCDMFGVFFLVTVSVNLVCITVFFNIVFLDFFVFVFFCLMYYVSCSRRQIRRPLSFIPTFHWLLGAWCTCSPRLFPPQLLWIRWSIWWPMEGTAKFSQGVIPLNQRQNAYCPNYRSFTIHAFHILTLFGSFVWTKVILCSSQYCTADVRHCLDGAAAQRRLGAAVLRRFIAEACQLWKSSV